jgi:hypothetical protein
MAKTTKLNAIPLANGNVDLNGYKLVNSGAITIGDMGVPNMGNGTTLTTTDWVEARG